MVPSGRRCLCLHSQPSCPTVPDPQHLCCAQSHSKGVHFLEESLLQESGGWIVSHHEKYTAEGTGGVVFARGCWGTPRQLGAMVNSLRKRYGLE